MSKSRNSHSMLTEESVIAWISDHNPGGVDKLRLALSRGEFRGERALMPLHYLQRMDALSEHAEKAVKDALYIREVKAAERAARWAQLSCAVSVVALAVAIWK